MILTKIFLNQHQQKKIQTDKMSVQTPSQAPIYIISYCNHSSQSCTEPYFTKE